MSGGELRLADLLQARVGVDDRHDRGDRRRRSGAAPSVSTMRSESDGTLRSLRGGDDACLSRWRRARRRETTTRPAARNSTTPSISTGAVAISASRRRRPLSWACSQAGPCERRDEHQGRSRRTAWNMVALARSRVPAAPRPHRAGRVHPPPARRPCAHAGVRARAPGTPSRRCARRCRAAARSRPVHPVWWLAPSPAPLSPWKYS